MGLFSNKEDKAVKQIENINRNIKAVRELMRKTPTDQLTRETISEATPMILSCATYWERYKAIISQMNFMQRGLFLGRTVPCWNGENVGVSRWEDYFKSLYPALSNEIRRLS